MKRLVEIVDDLITDWKRKPEVLFVDDNAEVTRAGSALLTQLHCDVTSFTSSPEATEHYLFKLAAEPNRRPYDLVFLDLKMPGMTGVEVLSEIRRHVHDQPVALMTGYAGEFDWSIISQLGYVGLILKPFSCSGLDDVLKAHNILINQTY